VNRFVSTFLAGVLIASAILVVGSPTIVRAAGGGDGCEPYRSVSAENSQLSYWKNTQSSTVGGVYANIYNYSPWISNASGTAGPNENDSAWTAVAQDLNNFAQVGWMEYAGNHVGGSGTGPYVRDVFAQIWTSGSPVTQWWPAETQDTSTYYTTFFAPGSSNGTLSFEVNGSLLSLNSTLLLASIVGWTPTWSQIGGEVHNLADQLPGDARSGKNELFEDSSYYASGSWHGYYGNSGTPPPYNEQPNLWGQSKAPESGKGGTLSIWDRYCPVSMGPAGSVSPSFGQQNLFWQGTDANLWEGWYTSSGWSGPSKIGDGPLGSQPSDAFTTDGGTQIVYWQGTDNALYEAWYTGNWYGPSKINSGPLAAPPSVITTPGQQDVFWRGTDNNLYEMWYASNGWNGPSKITTAGNMASAPGAAAGPSGTQYVYWKGSNGDIWETWYGGTWSTPTDLGFSSVASAPSAFLNPSNGYQYVYWQGTDLHVHEAIYSGSWSSSTPTNLASTMLGSDPSAVWNNGQGLLYWKGTDGNMYESYTSGSWNWVTPFAVDSGNLGVIG
jgi:hypothetical protein